MEKQTSFAQGEYARKKKTTRREKFLAPRYALADETLGRKKLWLALSAYSSGKMSEFGV